MRFAHIETVGLNLDLLPLLRRIRRFIKRIQLGHNPLFRLLLITLSEEFQALLPPEVERQCLLIFLSPVAHPARLLLDNQLVEIALLFDFQAGSQRLRNVGQRQTYLALVAARGQGLKPLLDFKVFLAGNGLYRLVCLKTVQVPRDYEFLYRLGGIRLEAAEHSLLLSFLEAFAGDLDRRVSAFEARASRLEPRV